MSNNYARTKSIIWNLVGKNDWRALESVDCLMYIYDTMPRRMKMALDYKMQGYTEDEISKKMNITKVTVYQHLQRAKIRIINSMLL